jgi:hypothetical protein
MPSAQVALATITLGSAQSTVTFSSIPATYRDLRLVVDLTPTAATYDIYGRFNGDSGSNYSYVEAGGNGSVTYSGASTLTFHPIGYLTTAAKTVIEFSVLDYSVTDKHKPGLVRQSTAAEAVAMRATRWANTSAITSLAVIASTSTFASGSVFSLYGILA